MEQSQRYSHLSELSGQLQKVTKTLGHYTNLGNQLCDALQEIITSLNEIEFVCTNSTFEKLMSSMGDIQNSLRNHFQKITNSSEKAMRQFVKTEIPDLTELKKNHEKLLEKYFTAQEKYLSISSKNQKLSTENQVECDEVLRKSTLTLYDYVSLIDLDETKTEHLISQFLLNFPKSFVESIKNLKQLDEDFSEIYNKSSNSIKYYYNKPDEGDNGNKNGQTQVDRDFLKVLNPDFESLEKGIRENRARVQNSIPNALRRLHNHMPEQNASKIVSKQGYLYRKKKNSKKFSKKFFTCANGQLSYSKTVENAHNPSFSINLAIATVQSKGEQNPSISNANSGSNFNSNMSISPSGSSSSDERPFVFKVVTPDCSLTLQALSLLDYDEWIAAIRNGILHALESGDLSAIPIKTPKHHRPVEIGHNASRDFAAFSTDDNDDGDLSEITKRKPKVGYGSLKVRTRRMSLNNRAALFKNPSPIHPASKQPPPTTPTPPPPGNRNQFQSPLPLPTTASMDKGESDISNNDASSKSNVPIFSSSSFTLSEPCKCADCGADIAEWIVANKALLICDKCAGCHRALAGVSSVRSLKLDKLDPYILKLLEMFPSNSLNKLYEGKFLEDKSLKREINSLSDVKQRQDFINKKYINHDFVKNKDKERFLGVKEELSSSSGEGDDDNSTSNTSSRTDIFKLIKDQDVEQLMLYLFLEIQSENPQPTSISWCASKQFLPIHAAAIVGNPISIAAIILNDPTGINKLDAWGWSPLSYATLYSNVAAVAALLTYRASISSSSAANPFKIATLNHHNAIIEMFNKAKNTTGESLGVDDATNSGPFVISSEVKKNFSPSKNVNKEEFLQLHDRAAFLKQELIRVQLQSQDQNPNRAQMQSQPQSPQQDPNVDDGLQKALLMLRKKGRKKSKTAHNDDY